MSTKKTTQDSRACPSRGQVTRERIIGAAKIVFSRQPYHSASIRMIATQGKFEHGIIRYHFPSKAILFKTIVQEICRDIEDANHAWLAQTARMPAKAALEFYLDKLFVFYDERPEALKIIALNLPQDGSQETIPGYEHIIQMLHCTRLSLAKNLPPQTPPDLVLRFLDAFNALVLHYLGASYCQAKVLGLPPKSKEYKEWVKDTMVLVFTPMMRTVYQAGRDAAGQIGR
ncbi:MAG: TetR/AcrR family transcriptional regulator [Desulfatibacillum sp.]|nr:TetR/AcrR family transcriptional regulator [Desulfatibacillum sp.]